MMTSEEDVDNVTMTSAMNAYNESSYGNYTDGMYEFYTVPQIVLVSVLTALIIGGNSCVLAAIRLSQNGRKSRMNFFIMHLALADLLVGVMVCLPDLASKITIEWYAGNALCKIVQYSQAVVTYSSTYMLVSLSIDRYEAVARPMNFSRSGFQGRFLVYMAWGVSFLFALPALFIYKDSVLEGKRQCWVDFPEFWHWQLFFTAIAVVTFLIPAIIIATCYIAIIYIIWSKGQNHESSGTVDRLVLHQAGISTPTRLTISRHETGRGIIPQAKIRTIKMTLIIVIVFIVCWSPYFLYNILDIYELLPYNNPVTTLIQSAAPLNSAANPIIYGIFSTRICKNLRRIPMPSWVRKMVCSCKESRRCNRRTFLGRSQKFRASQTTDPTLTTYEAHRRSNQCLQDVRLSPLKRGDRRCATILAKHIIDRAIFAETAADLLKRKELDKKQKLLKFPRNKWISDKYGGEYEMSPLARRGLTRNAISSGSDDSSATSDSNGRNSKRVSKHMQIVLERNSKNTEFAVKRSKEYDAILNAFSSDSEHSFGASRGIVDLKMKNTVLTKSEKPCEKCGKTINEFENQPTVPTSNSSSPKYRTKDDVTNSSSGSDSLETIAPVMPKVGLSPENIVEKETSFNDNSFKDQITSSAKENYSAKARSAKPAEVRSKSTEKSLATRRPSGIPSVRRRLTSEESKILNSVAERMLLSEVKASEPSAVD